MLKDTRLEDALQVILTAESDDYEYPWEDALAFHALTERACLEASRVTREMWLQE